MAHFAKGDNVVGCITKNSKKHGMVVGVTGGGHKRRFEVKWSDGTRTDETARGISIPGSAKALQVERKRKRQHSPDLIASVCEVGDENEEGRQEEGKEDDSEGEITEEDSG